MTLCRNGERMSDIAALKKEHQPKDWERLKIAIRTRISVLVGIVTIAGWLLSRVPSKRQRIDARDRDQDVNPNSPKIIAGSKQSKSGGGLLSLTLELLGAVAIRVQRYFKAWRSEIVVALKNSEATSSGVPPSRTAPKDFHNLPILDRKYQQRRMSSKVQNAL
jgi:hypothetical protein